MRGLYFGVFEAEKGFDPDGYGIGYGVKRGQENQGEKGGCRQASDDGHGYRCPHLCPSSCGLEELGKKEGKRQRQNAEYGSDGGHDDGSHPVFSALNDRRILAHAGFSQCADVVQKNDSVVDHNPEKRQKS